jgi:hypothetical protein
VYYRFTDFGVESERYRMQDEKDVRSVELFCAYSHKDHELQEEFKKSLAVLTWRKWVDIWTDHRIDPGIPWEEEISTHLNHAGIIVLLVSADFLSSDYCYRREMLAALDRAKRRTAVVLPIIVRPCEWSDAPFAPLQVLPRNGKAITLWDNRDGAWTEVAFNIKTLVKSLWEKISAGIIGGSSPGTAAPEESGASRSGSERSTSARRTLQNIQTKIQEIQRDLRKSVVVATSAGMVLGGAAMASELSSLDAQHHGTDYTDSSLDSHDPYWDHHFPDSDHADSFSHTQHLEHAWHLSHDYADSSDHSHAELDHSHAEFQSDLLDDPSLDDSYDS